MDFFKDWDIDCEDSSELPKLSTRDKKKTRKSDLSDNLIRTDDKVFIVEDKDRKCDQLIKIVINNINGNSNEVQMLPGEVCVAEGRLEDLNEETISKVIGFINELSKSDVKGIPHISIPIYIFNINNILSNGNKNTVSTK